MTSTTVRALLATVALGALISVANDLALAKGGGGHSGGGGHGGGGGHSGSGHGRVGPHLTGGGHGGHASPSAHFARAHGFSGAHLRAARHQGHSAHSFRGISGSGHFAHGGRLPHGSNFTRGNLAHSSNRLTHDPLHDPNWNHWGTTYSRVGSSTRWNNGWNGGCCEWWSGSVFWPYFFGDLLGFAFWPVGYYYPFWFDPYVFVWDTILWPDPYETYYAYGPSYSEYGYYDIYGGGGYYESDARTHRRHGTTGYAYAKTRSAPSQVELRSCGGLSPGITDLPSARIQTTLHLTGDQLAALDALRPASSQASEVLKTSCSNEVPLTPVARLDAVQKRTDTMIEAIRILRTPLDNFYNSLTEQQRQQFAALGPARNTDRRRPASDTDLAALCNPRTESFTQLPIERIEQFIRPTQQQQDTLEKLKTASTDAANDLQASCPGEIPQDPIGRFDAVAKRLDAMSAAIKTVRPALETFYASLADEQKAQFNTLGPPKTRGPHRG